MWTGVVAAMWLTTVAAAVTTPIVEAVKVKREEEDQICKIKGFPLSKQVGDVLERENNLFLGRKKEILSCLEEK